MADLKDDPKNPRRLSDEARKGLDYSLREFGDISGIVFNRQTEQLVGAHQRVEQIRRAIGAAPIEPDTTAAGADGEQWGHVIYLGHRFPVRIVDWTPAKQRAANIAANSKTIAGEFTDGLADFLLLIKEETPADFDALLFSELLTSPAKPPASQPPKQFSVIVACQDEPNQAATCEKLAAAGYECRLLTT